MCERDMIVVVVIVIEIGLAWHFQTLYH